MITTVSIALTPDRVFFMNHLIRLSIIEMIYVYIQKNVIKGLAIMFVVVNAFLLWGILLIAYYFEIKV